VTSGDGALPSLYECSPPCYLVWAKAPSPLINVGYFFERKTSRVAWVFGPSKVSSPQQLEAFFV
jgi:hypothetical protein